MTVRAKFQVTELHQSTHCQARAVVLQPVHSNDPKHENKKFWDATPSGEIKITISTPETAAVFEIGKEYYVDFTKAE